MELKDMNQQSIDYKNTMDTLKTAEQNLPGYSGSYDSEIKSIYSKIVKRPEFNYEFTADPVYRSYEDTYRHEGRLAMRDTMAEAAHLTGGYGSSYSQAVGQQQYGAYLEKLGQIMPELYSAAFQRYQAEGERLNAQLNAAGTLGNMEYQRYSDQQDRNLQQQKFEYQQQSDAYDALASAISSSGYSPSQDELEKAGMSAALAAALQYEFRRRNGLLPAPAPVISEEHYHGTAPAATADDEKKSKKLTVIRTNKKY